MNDSRKTTLEQTAEQPDLFFDDRFWEQYVGSKLVHDPVISIVELVANSWDAGAREVKISWPEEASSTLEVIDDGQGMTKAEEAAPCACCSPGSVSAGPRDSPDGSAALPR